MSETASAASADSSALASVLGKIPSGLFIVSGRSIDGQETGLLASWAQQASFEPPMITVAVNRSRYLNDWLRTNPVIGLNLVAEGQKEFLKHFGAGFEPGAAAFAGLNVIRGTTGVALLADSIGWLEGRITSHLETGDHVIYAVALLNAGTGERFAAGSPWVHIRKNGLKY